MGYEGSIGTIEAFLKKLPKRIVVGYPDGNVKILNK